MLRILKRLVSESPDGARVTAEYLVEGRAEDVARMELMTGLMSGMGLQPASTQGAGVLEPQQMLMQLAGGPAAPTQHAEQRCCSWHGAR